MTNQSKPILIMADETRAALQQKLEALDKIDASISALMDPYRMALADIQGMRDVLLLEHDVEINCNCEGCNKILFFGEQAHPCKDGPTLCAECAPTYNDCATQLRELLKSYETIGNADEGDIQDARDGLAAMEAIIADGRGDEKALYTL